MVSDQGSRLAIVSLGGETVWFGVVESLFEAISSAHDELGAAGEMSADWASSHFAGSRLLALWAPEIAKKHSCMKINDVEQSAFEFWNRNWSLLDGVMQFFTGAPLSRTNVLREYSERVFEREILTKLSRELLEFSIASDLNRLTVRSKFTDSVIGRIANMDGEWIAAPVGDKFRVQVELSSLNEAAVYLMFPVEKTAQELAAENQEYSYSV